MLLKNPEWWKIRIQCSEQFQGNSVFQSKRKLLKTLECKNYIQYSENFLGNSVFFRASASCSKILNSKKYIQYSEKFQGKLCFQGKRELLKILNVKSILTTVKIFRVTLFFQGKRKFLRNRELWKNFQYSVMHLGAIRVIWASVVCNQDQRRDLICSKPSFSVKIEQVDVDSSTAWYKNSVTLSLFVFETLFVFAG